jgi:hypothetical protein
VTADSLNLLGEVTVRNPREINDLSVKSPPFHAENSNPAHPAAQPLPKNFATTSST